MSEVDDCLMVKVVEARNLLSTPSGPPQAFAVVQVGNERESTAVADQGNSPAWESTTMVFTGIVNAGIDNMRVLIRSRDPIKQIDLKLGMVPIDLADVLHSPYLEIDEWYPIVREVGMGEPPTGEVRLQFTYFLQRDETLGAGRGEEEGKEAAGTKGSKTPNLLTVNVVRARGLRLDDVETLDPIAVVEVSEMRKETKVARRSNNPKWDGTFSFAVTKGDAFVEVSVMNVGYISRTLVGKARVSMVEVAGAGLEGFKRWCPLFNEEVTASREPRGEVELNMTWTYDAEASTKSGFFNWAAAKKKKKVTKLEQEVSTLMAATEVEEMVVRKQRRTKDQQEAYEAARKERQEAAVTVRETMDISLTDEIKEGDYQIQVHLIEARDLAAADLGSTSDPCIYVYILGQKKRTRVIKKTTSCVFDETLYFNFKNLSREELEKVVIKITCFDADTFKRWDIIGQTQFDLKWVYSRKDHEFYRQWVALYNTKKKEAGVQGYVRMSISVLGPGDHQAQHDMEEEMRTEMAEEDQEGGPASAMVAGPSQAQELMFLVLTVFYAEDIPMMDTMTYMGGAGIDAIVQLDMGGSQPCKSSCVTVKGKGNLAPVFNEELWMPVMDPPASNRVAVSLWDRNYTTKNTVVGYAYFDYRKLRRKLTPEGGVLAVFSQDPQPFAPPFWIVFYGAPNENRAGRTAEFVGTYPEFGSTYRGRILVSLHVVTKPKPNEGATPHTKRLKYDLQAPSIPETTRYTFRMHLVFGSEIPVFQGVTGASKMGVRVLIGPHVVTFPCKPNKKGVVLWDELREVKALVLPKDLNQLPDIIVQLYKYPEGIGPCVSFARIPAVKALAEQFKQEPYWQALQADRVRENTMSGVQEDDHPGALLLKLGFGTDEDAQEEPWGDALEMLKDKSAYVLRVHVYQCRNLPSTDENGLLDPYVKIRFAGVKKKTKTKRLTTSPLFYETLEFQEVLPNDLRFAPEIVLQVWDQDTMASNTPVAMLRFPFNKCTVARSDRSMPPPPKWMPLSDVNGRPGSGDVLVSFQYFKKVDPNADVEPPPDITPRMRTAWIEITLVGLRDLKKYGFTSITEPYVQFQVSSNGDNTWQPASSKTPTPKDPNFLTRHTLAVELPENAAFAPQLEIRVFDRRLGGLSHPLIGANSVRLDSKLPWNTDDYVPPLSMELKHGKEIVNEQEEDESADPADRDEGGEEGEEADIKGDEGAEEGEGDGEGEKEKEKKGSRSTSQREPEDAGTGVFPLHEDVELGRFREDIEYEESVKRAEEEARRRGKGQPATLLDLASLTGGKRGDRLADLPINFPQTWASSDFIEDRDWLLKDKKYEKKELEYVLENAPFEVYPLFRGATKGRRTMLGDTSLRVVGILKGIIRVCTSDPRYEKTPFFDLKKIAKSVPCVVRLYVVKAMHLQPTDMNGSADPYVVVKLGKQRFSDRDNHQNKTLEPEFYRCFEFQTELPGPSRLKVQIFDWDRFLADDLIGETIIDLEDRWFHPKWQDMGLSSKRVPKVGPVKPIEARSLWVQRSKNPQGQVQLWADILTVKEARKYAKEEISGPPEQKVEVRIICWKSRGVKGKGVASIVDLYGQFWMEGQNKRQETDTHWRCKNGSASWNYRLKFTVTLPLKPEFARLKFQLWDRDILKWNDVIAEGSIDLYRWFLLAYHRKSSVKPFKEIKDAEKRKQAQALTSILPPSGVLSGGQDTELKEVVVMPSKEDQAEGEGEGGFKPFEYDDVMKADEEEEEEKQEKKPLLPKASRSLSSGGGGGADDDGAQEGETKEPDDEKSSEDDAKDFINQIKTYLGIGEIAEDAQWIPLIYHDHDAGRIYERGEIAISVDIVPFEEAENRKVGYGRDEPNTNPYLPPPVGRMQFSLNPFVMFKELLGPRIVFQIICCCCCILVLVLGMLLGTYMSGLVSLFEVFSGKIFTG